MRRVMATRIKLRRSETRRPVEPHGLEDGGTMEPLELGTELELLDTLMRHAEIPAELCIQSTRYASHMC